MKQNTGETIVDGDYYEVPTDAGKLVQVWVANDQSIADHLKYYCHGHSFGTYEEFGYTVAEIDERLFEEWEFVGEPVHVNRGGSEVALGMGDGLHRQLREVSNSGRRLVAVAYDAASYFDHLKVSLDKGSPTWALGSVVHSFRINSVSEFEKDFLESSASSKNTFGHFEAITTIKGQLKMYKNIASLRFLGKI